MEESTVKFTSRTLAHLQHSLAWMSLFLQLGFFGAAVAYTRLCWSLKWKWSVNYKLLGNENDRLLWVATPFRWNSQGIGGTAISTESQSQFVILGGERDFFCCWVSNLNFHRTIVSPSEVAWTKTIIGILEVEQSPFTCLSCLFQHNRFSQLIIEIT